MEQVGLAGVAALVWDSRWSLSFSRQTGAGVSPRIGINLWDSTRALRQKQSLKNVGHPKNSKRPLFAHPSNIEGIDGLCPSLTPLWDACEVISQNIESALPPRVWLVTDQEATTLLLAEMTLAQFIPRNRRK